MVTPILQARMCSTRLPGKVLKQLCGDTVLAHIIRRISRVSLASIIVATGENVADDPIEAECARLGVNCFRGSETDVLSRFYEAAKANRVEHIMRICADNPLIEPAFLNELADYYRESGHSYVCSVGTPVGLGAEVFTFERLEDAYINGLKPYHREHVTPFMYENNIDCGRLDIKPDHSRMRFTLDTPEDFAFITAVYESLYKKSPEFGLDEVLALLREQPELMELNRNVRQRPVNDEEDCCNQPSL